MNTSAVVINKNVLTSDVSTRNVEVGLCISDILDYVGIPEIARDCVRVHIGDIEIQRDNWDYVTPKENSGIYISIIPHGGDSGGKNPLALIATIALVAFVPQMATFITGTTSGFAFTAVKLGITLLGGALINAIFPPPSVDQPRTPDATGELLTFNGQSNSKRPFDSMMRVYGEHTVFPDLIGDPYTLSRGDDQFLYVLYSFGYGPLNVRNLRVGETPIGSFRSVDVNVTQSFTKDSFLEHYTRDVGTQSFSFALEEANSSFTATTELNTASAIVDLSFPQGLREIADNGNNVDVEIEFKVEFRPVGAGSFSSYGSISHSFTKSVSSQSVAGPSTFTINEQFMDVSSTFDDNFNFIIREEGFIRSGSSSISITSNGPISANSTFSIDGHTYTITNSGSGTFNASITPALRRDYKVMSIEDVFDPVQFITERIPVRETFHAIPISSSSAFINLRTNQPFILGIRLDFPSADQYEVKVTRVTEKSSSDRVLDDMTYSALKSISPSKPSNIDIPITVVELEIKATDQLSGVIDTLNADCFSKLDVWNGSSFIEQETNNPAWIAVDVLRGSANNRPLANSRIDLDRFLEFANHCDANGYTCNFVLTSESTVWDLLTNILSTGRGSPTIRDGKYSVIYEGQSSIPVQMITPKNSNGFSSTRTLLEYPDAIRVSYNNKEKRNELDELIVYNDGFDESNASVFEELTLFGIDSTSLAHKHGRYFLAEGKLRQETFRVTMDIENLIAERGDIVLFQYDVCKVGGDAKRIVEINSNQIYFDEPIIALPSNPVLKVRTEESQITTKVVSNQDSDYSVTVTDTVDLSVGQLCVLGESETLVEEMLVKVIEPEEDFVATVTLVPRAEAILLSDEEPIPDFDPVVTNPITGIVPGPISFLSVSESITYNQRLPVVNIVLAYELPSGAFSSFEIYRKGPDDEEFVLIKERHGGFTFVDTPDPSGAGTLQSLVGNQIQYKVLATSFTGKKLPLSGATSAQITIVGDTVAPPAPTQFSLQVSQESTTAQWTNPDAPDIESYVIRYSPSLTVSDVSDSVIAFEKVSFGTNSVTFPTNVGTYFIQSRDTSGNLSTSFTFARTSIAALSQLNIIHSINDASTWPGTHTNTEVLSGNLVNAQVTSSTRQQIGTYIFGEVFDLGEIFEVLLQNKIKARATAHPFFISDWGSLSEIDTMSGSPATTLWNVSLEVRTLSDPILTPLTADLSDWTTWVPVFSTSIVGRYLQFRIVITTETDNILVEVVDGTVEVDMPDRTESDQNVVSGTSTKSIAYNIPFREVPVVAITAESMASGDYFEITNKSTQGFDITFKNSSDVNVSRTFDWMAKGFGKQTAQVISQGE